MIWDFEGDTHGQVGPVTIPQMSRQRQSVAWSRNPQPPPVAPVTVSPGARWWASETGATGTLPPPSAPYAPTGTAFWQQLQQRQRAAAQNGGLQPLGTTYQMYGNMPYIRPPSQPVRRRRRDWAQWIEDNNGQTLRLIPYDEETMPDVTPYIGFVQDWGNGSFVLAQVDDKWRKRKLEYRRGSEMQNPQMALGWSPAQVVQWRDKVRFLSQWMDFGTDGDPFGVTGNDWTPGDMKAMEWFMAWSNENGTDVNTAVDTWVGMAQDGSLDNFGEQEGEGGGGGAEDEPPPLERTVQRTFTLYDLDDARAMLTSQIANLLGRQPRDDEVSEFLTALNTRAKANPTVTTYDYTYDEFGRAVETDITTDPGRGIDTVALARKEALEGNRGEMERYHLGLAQDVLAELAGM